MQNLSLGIKIKTIYPCIHMHVAADMQEWQAIGVGMHWRWKYMKQILEHAYTKHQTFGLKEAYHCMSYIAHPSLETLETNFGHIFAIGQE